MFQCILKIKDLRVPTECYYKILLKRTKLPLLLGEKTNFATK